MVSARFRVLPLCIAGVAAAGVLVGLTPPPPATAAVAACTKYASTAGSDSAAGTQAAPYRTSQKLADNLSAGQVGCLQAGAVFGGVNITRSGITLTTAPGGAKATLLGRTTIPDVANDVVLDGLVLNGRTSGARVSPDVQGDRVVLRGNDITNDNTAICLHIGSNAGYGVAYDVVVDSNRIFNCGRMPATNFDHGIYVNNAENTRITNNLIYDNSDYGVHLYPGAQHTYVANNVIDGNGRGVTFSGENGFVSNNNLVENNIISNSLITHNVESWWGGQVGVGNRADSNCLWNGKQGNIATQTGFTATGNTIADPMFTNRAAKDFSLRPGSPCAGKGPQANPTAAPPPSAGTTPPPPAVAPRRKADERKSATNNPKSRQAARKPTAAQLRTNRRLVVTLVARVARVERKVYGRAVIRVPSALSTSVPGSSASQMRATRAAAANSLRRVSIVLDTVQGKRRAVAPPVTLGRVPVTVGEIQATVRIARTALARVNAVERIIGR